MSINGRPNRREFLSAALGSTAVGAAAALGTRPAFGQIAPPKSVIVASKKVIGPGDLTYLGGWRTPDDAIGPYSSIAMCIRYVGGERRFLMVEFGGSAHNPGDIVELQAPSNPTPYIGSLGAAWSVDMSGAPQMRVTRRWAKADWRDSWIGSSFYQAQGPEVGSLYWDDSAGLLWFCVYDPYATGWNAPIWGAVNLLDTVKSGVYCNVGSKYGPWYYRSATLGSDYSQSPYCRGQNQFIVPVPVSERALIGGAKFLIGAGHQGYEADAAYGTNLHVLSDFSTGMANPVPVVKQLCEYTSASLLPKGQYACRRDGTNYIPTATGDVYDKIGNDAPCGPFGGAIKGVVWVDTGTKHGLINIVGEKNGYVGYWHYNPKTDGEFPTAYDPACRTRTSGGYMNGPKASIRTLALRIFNPDHFAEVFARRRGPYAATVSSGPYAGLPGMRIAIEANMRAQITNGATIPAQDISTLDKANPADGDTADAIQVGPVGQDTDFNGAAWDAATKQIVWVQYRAWSGGHVFCLFSVS